MSRIFISRIFSVPGQYENIATHDASRLATSPFLVKMGRFWNTVYLQITKRVSELLFHFNSYNYFCQLKLFISKYRPMLIIKLHRGTVKNTKYSITTLLRIVHKV